MAPRVSSDRPGGLPAPRPLDPGRNAVPPEGSAERRRDVAGRSVRARLRSTLRERRLGDLLDRAVGDVAHVLHHRRISEAGATIDHLVVAPTGVWAVSACHHRGSVTSEGDDADDIVVIDTLGGITPVDPAALDITSHVRAVVDEIGYDWVPVHHAVCFTNARLARRRRVGGSVLIGPRRLVAMIVGRGALRAGDLQTIASSLQARLPHTDRTAATARER